MQMNPSIFREYDIRGVAERDFDRDFVERLGRAFATCASERGVRRLVVGRDCRESSSSYAEALKAGIRAGGVAVVDIGECPTPLLYFSMFHFDLDGGVAVTASHNPPEYNGFKVCLGKTTLYGEEIQALRRLVEAGRFSKGQGAEEARSIIPPYQDYLRAQFGRLPRELQVVVDAGNGMTGPVAPPVLREMGCRVIELYCDPDSRFPNHHPDPTVEENLADLIRTVRSRGAATGIAYDGDGDRIGVVDETGRIIWGDELLVLFARSVLAKCPGAVVVSEVKCSQRLFDDIAAHGGRPVMWKAGHSLLKAKMRETGALLGGEMSGHIFFADRYFGYDDAIYASCRLLEILAADPEPLSARLADLPHVYNTPEIRVECPDEVKFAVADAVRERFRECYKTIDIDGVRVQFPEGWALVRASNTGPVLVLRFEASSPEKLAEYREAVERTLAEARRSLGA